jgi:hypothetical protein
MTDTTSPSKPMWTRCPGCKDRVFNDKLDIGIHRQHCPADLQKRLQELDRRFTLLERNVEGLDQQVSAEPALDPDDVAPWDDDEDDPRSTYLDDYTGDEDDEPTSATPFTGGNLT